MSLFTNRAFVPSHRCPQPGQTLVRDFVHRRLSREERLVVILRYGENLTTEDIAAVLDWPAERVARTHDEVVSRVRAQLVPAVDEQILVA